jgi:hypothetical protein
VRPERCWPRLVGVVRWTGTPHGGCVGGPELPYPPCVVLGWRSGLVGGVPARILCWVRGPAGRRLIATPRPRLPIATAAP